MDKDRIVAVGFLTQRDLSVLGTGFDRLFPVAEDAMFDDLLAQLDHVEASSVPGGVALRLDRTAKR